MKVEPSQGSDTAMVFITGYLTEKDFAPHHHKPWTDNLRQAGWQGAIYYLWWDSSNKDNQFSTCLQLGIGAAFHWEKHKKRAKIVGRYYLEKLVHQNVEEKSVSLIAHSLGARILYFGGERWSSGSLHKLNNMILLGGAIPKSRNWDKIVSTSNSRIFNIYNPEDFTLKNMYRYSSYGLNPCGLREINSHNSKIKNINVNEYMGRSHNSEKYLKTLPELTARGLIIL